MQPGSKCYLAALEMEICTAGQSTNLSLSNRILRDCVKTRIGINASLNDPARIERFTDIDLKALLKLCLHLILTCIFAQTKPYMKKALVRLLVITTIVVSFLFSQNPSKEAAPAGCPVNYIALNSKMGFPVNCDAPAFIGAAIKPAYLFSDGYDRQSRPLYILSGTVLGYTVYYLSYPLHDQLSKWSHEKIAANASNISENHRLKYICFYIGFVLLNTIILFIALLLFENIIGLISGTWKNGKMLFYAMCLLLFSNQITQHFFWTAHSQLFNLLMPLLSIYLGLVIFRQDHTKKPFIISFLSGCLLLFYGNFLLLLPVLLTIVVWKNYKKISFLEIALLVFQLAFLFFLPTLIWVFLLYLNGVAFYSAELEQYRQFIWVIDSLKDNTVLASFKAKTILFIQTTGGLLFPAVLLGVVKLYLFYTSKSRNPYSKANSGSNNIMGVVLLFAIVFFWLLGYYADRLTTGISILLVCYLAAAVNQQKNPKIFNYSLCLVILCYHLFAIAKAYPHFSSAFYK